jgi:hypothetical protein
MKRTEKTGPRAELAQAIEPATRLLLTSNACGRRKRASRTSFSTRVVVGRRPRKRAGRIGRI